MLPQIFKYEAVEVRTFTKEDNSVWFVGLDVCKILDLKNNADALNKLKESQKDVIVLTDPIGRKQNYTIISEPGLYKLIMKSRKKEAENFQDWIAEEVLPAIRKTGSYTNQAKTPAEMLLESAQLMVKLEKEQALIKSELQETTSKIDTLLMLREKNLKKLHEIERSQVLPLQKATRALLNELVRNYSNADGLSISEVWNKLYKEFLYRYSINVKTCAKNRGISNLDYVESIHKMEELFSVASQILI